MPKRTALTLDANRHPIQSLGLPDKSESSPGVVHKIAVSSTSAAMSAAVGGHCTAAYVWADVDVHVAHHANDTEPTAVDSSGAADTPLTAKVPVIVKVVPGKSRLAFIKQVGQADGVVYVTEME